MGNDTLLSGIDCFILFYFFKVLRHTAKWHHIKSVHECVNKLNTKLKLSTAQLFIGSYVVLDS